MVTITKEFSFDSAHNLPWHKGKCFNLHGHTYKLSVTIGAALNENGIVMDFGDLKEIVKRKVVDKLDHHYLNDIFDNPTAELMTEWIAFQISEDLPDGIILKKVSLWETPTSYATWEPTI